MKEDELLEKLSSLEHEQWIFWSKSLASPLARYTVTMDKIVRKYNFDDELDYTDDIEEDMDTLIGELWSICTEITSRLLRWDDYYKPYVELSEDVKEDDRVHARKVIELLKEEKIL